MIELVLKVVIELVVVVFKPFIKPWRIGFYLKAVLFQVDVYYPQITIAAIPITFYAPLVIGQELINFIAVGALADQASISLV